MRYLLTIIGFIVLLLGGGCRGCSKSARMEHYYKSGANPASPARDEITGSGGNTVKMKKEGGVYMVPVEINGVSMDFIFDTGASDITMSLAEALFLYRQNKLSDSDFRGLRQYQIADGSIAEGTIVILKSVKIANRTLNNVEASIVHNLDAPLLMGQSALSRFGRITIDYNKGEITFN